MDIQRKAFEAYMADRYKNTVDQRVCINSDGDYMAWDMQVAWHVWQAANAQAVPEGFGLFDGDTLTYSNGYSINCSFDDEFDCHIFDVYQNEDCVKDGMTQLEQAHCLVLSMIKLDAKDSMIEALEPTND